MNGPRPEERVERYQWRRNKEGRQASGNQQEIRPLTEGAFQTYVRPLLREGYSRTLGEYQAKHPKETHYSVIKRAGDNEWQFRGIGTLQALRPEPDAANWALRVEVLDSPEARRWGETADSEVGPD